MSQIPEELMQRILSAEPELNSCLPIPRLICIGAPAPDQKYCAAISLSLDKMFSFLQSFDSAIRLIEYCEIQSSFSGGKYSEIRLNLNSKKQPYFSANHDGEFWFELGSLYGNWMMIAAREAAMSVWHISDALRGIKQEVNNSVFLKTLVDQKALKAATKTFNSFFPHAEGIRHAIAHSSELTESTKKIDKNASKKPYKGSRIQTAGPSFLGESLDGRTLILSHKGETRSLELSSRSTINLIHIISACFSAFSAAEVTLTAEYKRMRDCAPPEVKPDSM